MLFYFTIGADIEFQATLAAANDYLRSCHINSRYAQAADEWPPYQPKHYTTLALIHHKDKSTDATIISFTEKLVVTGKFQHNDEDLSPSGSSISQIPNKYSKNISDIFISVTANNGCPGIILIEGAPGIGKTVLSKEIAFKWANNKLLIDKKILFLLFLRQYNFKTMVSLESFVQYMVKSTQMTASLTKYLLQTEGNNLIIVLDGYDEISDEDRKTSIVADIIDRKILAKCCLVITSRPTASSNLRSVVDCRIEIVGFTEKNRLDYIQTALQGNNDKVEALKMYLWSNPTINALCYIPLNMTILLCLVKDGIDRLPKAQTDMYYNFVEVTILHFIRKLDMQISKTVTSISELPDPYNKVFEELTRLAYKALKIDKVVFRLKEIKDMCPNIALSPSNWSGLGLLKVVQCNDIEMGNVTFNFLHFSIQEYLAAWYISTLPNGKQIKLLEETFWEHRYYNTWIMYVGITCGKSFSLKHFLSGNKFQLFTKIFKTSSVSKKYLSDKIKCLHLFQCLLESNNEGMIAPNSLFFQDDQIDLSNQTLLPSDINTLGLFLIRSINKHWKMLDLSGCNIRSVGVKILYDRFSNKESFEMVVINTIDFSNNQLEFSSLMQIFDLFKSWKTSQLIIKDSGILENNPNSDIYKVIEDAFCLSNYNDQVSLQLGHILFANQISRFSIPFSATVIKSMFLLNCKLTIITTGISNFKETLKEIHLINTILSKQLLKKMCTYLLNTDNNTTTTLFMHNPELSDQDADEICSLILSYNVTNTVMLIISKSKIQGIINTSTIYEQLTNLEIFNLAANVKQISIDNIQIHPWKMNLCDHDGKDNTFIKLFRTSIKFNWLLRFALVEKNCLIVHNVNNIRYISKKTEAFNSFKKLIISNSYITDEVANNIAFSLSSNIRLKLLNISGNCIKATGIIKIAKSLQQISTLQKVCLSNNNITDEAADDIAAAIHSSTQLQELDISKNNLQSKGAIKIAKALQNISTLTKLYIHDNHIADEAADDIANALSCNTKLVELDISDNRFQTIGIIKIIKVFRSMFISDLKKLCISNNNITDEAVGDIADVLSSNIQLELFNISGNYIKAPGIIRIARSLQQTSTLKQLYISNNNITNEAADDITAALSCNSQLQELNINNNPLQATGIITMAKALQSICTLKKLSICNTNITDEAQGDIVSALTSNIKIESFDMSENYITIQGIIKIAKALQQVSTLQQLNISSNYITDEAADDIAAVIYNNTNLKEFNVSKNNLQSTGAIKIAKALQNISTLRKLYINNNNITDQAADDIAVALFCNYQLQELDISNNRFQTPGIIAIVNSLQNIATLTKLFIGDYSLRAEGVNNIVLVLQHNTELQELDIGSNINGIIEALHKNANLRVLKMKGNNNIDQAVEVITSVVSCNTKLQVFDISEMVTMNINIMRGLQCISSLTSLCISNNNITDEIADDIAAAISSNAYLLEFDVSNNALTTTGAIKISKALQGIFTLKRLYINNNIITYEAAVDIAKGLSKNAQLQELNISNNYFQAVGVMIIMKALQGIFTLKKLYIGNNDITVEATDDIAGAVCSNTRLQKIDVSDNNFQSVGAIKIAKALKSISRLTGLCISNNNITDEGADDIASAIYNNTQLQEFNIASNNLQSTGAIKIAEALQNISTLKKLHISSNNISAEAAHGIAAAVYVNKQLQELYMDNNNLQSTGIMIIAKTLKYTSTLRKLCISNNNVTDKAADDIAAVICNNIQLNELNISRNNFQSIGAIIIAKALQKISAITKLYINNNQITDEAANDIAVICSNNTQLQTFQFGGNLFTYTVAHGLYIQCKKLSNFRVTIRY